MKQLCCMALECIPYDAFVIPLQSLNNYFITLEICYSAMWVFIVHILALLYTAFIKLRFDFLYGFRTYFLEQSVITKQPLGQ